MFVVNVLLLLLLIHIIPVAHPKFPWGRGGAQTSEQGEATYYFLKVFLKSAWKWNNLDWGGHTPLMPPSDLPLHTKPSTLIVSISWVQTIRHSSKISTACLLRLYAPKSKSATRYQVQWWLGGTGFLKLTTLNRVSVLTTTCYWQGVLKWKSLNKSPVLTTRCH